MSVDRLLLTTDRAADAYDLMARIQAVRRALMLPYSGTDDAIAKRLDAASLAYDLAVSVGRRWSAPSWLEEVAY